MIFGAPGRIRTSDPQIRSLVLDFLPRDERRIESASCPSIPPVRRDGNTKASSAPGRPRHAMIASVSGTAWSRFIFIRSPGTIHTRFSRSNSRHRAPSASFRRTPVRITNLSARSTTPSPSVAINAGTSSAAIAALGSNSATFLESISRSRAHVAGFGSTCFAVKIHSMSRRNRLPRLFPGPFHIGRNVSATCSVVIRFTGTSASAPACIRTSAFSPV